VAIDASEIPSPQLKGITADASNRSPAIARTFERVLSAMRKTADCKPSTFGLLWVYAFGTFAGLDAARALANVGL